MILLIDTFFLLLFSKYAALAQRINNSEDGENRLVVAREITVHESSEESLLGYGRGRRAATARKERLWPYGVIPYEISPKFSGEHKVIFQQAMRHWENYTCITFIPRQKEHLDYIFFTVDKCGCCSYVGRKGGGPQAISIGKNCNKFGIVVHELGHVIGFWHEHTRIDRDEHVTISYRNIQHAPATEILSPICYSDIKGAPEIVKKGQDYNFDKMKSDEVNSLGEPYDYASIMHYAQETFARNPFTNTIHPKVIIDGKRPEIGQRLQLSRGDIRQTNKLYQCLSCFQTLTAEFGELYLTSLVCAWRIIGAVGSTIRISIFVPEWESNFDCTEKSENAIIVRDGPYVLSPILGVICGGQNQETFFSSSSRLYIQARLSVLPAEFSFASYKILCGGVLKADFGTIQTPQFPEHYLPNHTCEWVISVSEGYRVALIFRYFVLESHKSCIYDQLEIYNGAEKDEAHMVAKLCGQVKSKVIISDNNTVLVRFSSDSTVQKPGFHIDFVKEFDECEVYAYHKCEHECVNEIGGYRCACKIGYSLREDGKTCQSTCGGFIEGASGAFYSPNFPLEYPSLQDCIWEFEAQEGYQIIINFTRFDVEGMKTECAYDYVALYDQFGNAEKYCGFYEELLVYTSSSNRLRARFVSDASVEKSGFAAYFMTDIDECQEGKGGCEQICINSIGSYRCECEAGYVLAPDGRRCKEGGCHFQLNNPDGEITSPGYPLDYPNEKHCDWHIVTTPGHRLVIAFEEFELEEQNLCKYDRLELFDGSDSRSYVLGTFCGNKIPKSVETTSNELYISLSSDASVARRGFKVSYSSVCGGNLKVESFVGYIYSHARYGDVKYEGRMNCVWHLLAPQGKGVRLDFLQFEVENGQDCFFDYVEIYDGWDRSDLSLRGRFCGEMVPPVFISSGRRLLIVFKTDDSDERKGFVLEYRTAEPSAVVLPPLISFRKPTHEPVVNNH